MSFDGVRAGNRRCSNRILRESNAAAGGRDGYAGKLWVCHPTRAALGTFVMCRLSPPCQAQCPDFLSIRGGRRQP